MKSLTLLIGRILVGQIFIIAGLEKIMDPAGTQGYMAAHGMPFTGVLMVMAIMFELGGGLSLLFGFKARWGALALFFFLIPTTLIFHTKFSDPTQPIMFMKNLAIMGGLLMLAAGGAGRLSLDAVRAVSAERRLSRE